MSDFKKIVVLGLGMMGGSITKALFQRGFQGEVFGFDKDAKSVETAFKAGYIKNRECLDQGVLEKADLLLLATPIGVFSKILMDIKEHISPTCIVSDIGSVKQSVHEIAKESLLPGQIFIGGHPMIGSEKVGFDASEGHLFENAFYFLTTEDKDSRSIEKLKKFVAFIGAKACVLTAEKHDAIVARTSHMPHLSATLLVSMMAQKEGSLIDYVGSGFRDTTRIASGNPEMWTDIFMHNKKELLSGIDGLMDQLNDFKNNLQTENSLAINTHLKKAKKLRERIPKHLIDAIEPVQALVVDIIDQPGAIAAVATLLAKESIGIKDIEILHVRERIPGVLNIGFYSRSEKEAANDVLVNAGYKVTVK